MDGYTLAKEYEQGHLCGWLETRYPGSVQKYLNLIGPQPRYSLFNEYDRYKGTKTMLYQVCRKVLGKDTPNYPQQIGDCVSFGAKNATECLSCCDILLRGDREQFKLVFPPYYYGTGRVYVGGWDNDYSDGSLGSYMAQAVMKYGTLFTDEPGLPSYSGSVAKEFGAKRSTLDKWLPTAKKYLVKSAAQINSWEELVTAIANGYPCATASDIGYSMQPSSDGFHRQTTSWAHQMCALPNTLIKSLIPKEIQDIKIGDKVVTDNGELNNVTEVYVRPYKGKIVTIKAFGTSPIELTDNHPVLVLRDVDATIDTYHELNMIDGFLSDFIATKKKVKIWVEAKNIKVGDYLISPKINLKNQHSIIPDYVNPKRKNSKNLVALSDTPDIAWFLGLYIADGGASKNHKISITLNKTEIKTAVRACKVIKKLGLKPRILRKNNFIRVIGYSFVLANSFLQWFSKQENKRIPEWLWSWKNIDSVVEGIFDGDGCYVKNINRRRISNTSKILIDQIQTILVSQGIKCSVSSIKHNKIKYPNFKTVYTIDWSESPKKNNRIFIDEQYLALQVRDISFTEYNGDVYNLEVANRHNYVAENILIHNCFIGVDDNDKDPYAIILNSWGDAHGKLKDFETGEELPIGVLRVRKNDALKHIRAKETYAYSQFDGFPANNINEKLLLLI